MLVICDMYNFLLKSVFNKDISYNDINKSIYALKKNQFKLIYSSSIRSRLYLFNKNKVLHETSQLFNRTLFFCTDYCPTFWCIPVKAVGLLGGENFRRRFKIGR